MAAKTRKPVRVTVTISLDVDPEAWAFEYGEDDSAADVRASVKSYVGNAIASIHHAQEDGGAWSSVDWK